MNKGYENHVLQSALPRNMFKCQNNRSDNPCKYDFLHFQPRPSSAQLQAVEMKSIPLCLPCVCNLSYALQIAAGTLQVKSNFCFNFYEVSLEKKAFEVKILIFDQITLTKSKVFEIFTTL